MTAPSQPTDTLSVLRMAGVNICSQRDERSVVLEDVSWEIHAGDFWVIAGLQGSGKTDLLLALAGLIPPASGEYTLFGERMPIYEEERMATRLRLGLVFDGGQLFNHLSIADNISLPLRYHRNLDRAGAQPELQRLMDALELSVLADTTPGALGRNWQRRAGLARALALGPEILLLDNPLGGLDLPHRNWWLAFLDALSKGHSLMNGRPMTLVVTAADLRPWRSLARQFAVLRGKRFAPLGAWSNVQKESPGEVRDIIEEEFLG